MKKKNILKECCTESEFFKRYHGHKKGNGAIYGLGVVGALFYFMQGAANLGMVIVGIVKAFFWPAILMFELLSYLQL